MYCVYIVGNYCVGSVLYQVRKLIQEARLPLFRFCFLFFSDLPQSNPTEIIGPETRHTQAAMKSPTNDMARNRFHMTKFFEENRPPSPIKGAASKFGQPKEARIKNITPHGGMVDSGTCSTYLCNAIHWYCFDCFRKVSIKKCIPNVLLKFPNESWLSEIAQVHRIHRWFRKVKDELQHQLREQVRCGRCWDAWVGNLMFLGEFHGPKNLTWAFQVGGNIMNFI